MNDWLKRIACRIGWHWGWLDRTFDIRFRRILRASGFRVQQDGRHLCPVCYREHRGSSRGFIGVL